MISLPALMRSRPHLYHSTISHQLTASPCLLRLPADGLCLLLQHSLAFQLHNGELIGQDERFARIPHEAGMAAMAPLEERETTLSILAQH